MEKLKITKKNMERSMLTVNLQDRNKNEWIKRKIRQRNMLKYGRQGRSRDGLDI